MSWRQSSDGMRSALKDVVVPALRERGFRGSFPHYARIREHRIDLLSFQFSQFGPNLYIEIGSCPAAGAEQADGTRIPPAKVRTYHAGLYRRRIGPSPSLDFEGVKEPEDAKPLAAEVLHAINTEGETWWLSPTPIVPT
jgi:hypothetical protein